MPKTKSAKPTAAPKTRRTTKSTPSAPRKAPDQPAVETSAFPIVGIGASAGGLEALSALLGHLPLDTGLAYVIVQHLDPRHSSILTDLLGRDTTLPVQEVVNDLPVLPDHVYVIPPNMDLGLLHGRLNLMPRTEARQQHMPIDYFFRTLAEDQKNRAIGVILSGTGTDGTLGLRAIKAESGLTFAQDDATAKYTGMPRSAVAAGVVDLVLSPERIAQELAGLKNRPMVAVTQVQDDAEIVLAGDEEINRLFLLLRAASGVDFSFYKPTTVNRRIARRMLLHRLVNLADYVRFIQENPAELDALFQDLLINVTGFFREPGLFESLQKKILPRLFKDRTAGLPLRVWVPGCSTGEEVYSLAICLLEYLKEVDAIVPIQIFGTDVSDAAIESARVGLYLENIMQDVSPEQLRKYFVRADGGYQISKAVRDLCIFARQDVTRDPPFSRIDLISCRNLLIYLTQAMQRKVIATFHYALRPGGLLVLGSSETIGSSAELFTLIDKQHKLYAKKSIAPRMELVSTQLPTLKIDPVKRAVELAGGFDLQHETDRLLLSKYAPAGVLINDNLDILQFRGRTGRYLEPAAGAPSPNLLKMAREGLLLELRSAIQEAQKHNTPAARQAVRVRSNGDTHLVNLSVIPVLPPDSKERYFLVLFEDSGPEPDAPPAPKADQTAAGRAKQSRTERQLAEVQQELTVTKEYLHSTIGQLESANEELHSALEEIQSSNEELQSTNEELETAKEELQSTNEELTTVNEELQNRNLELTGLNNDLVNLIGSANIPIVILGADLRIRRFTPMAEKVLNLIAADIGRPISDLRLTVSVPDLEQIVSDVVERLEAREIEVQDQRGRWYSVRIRPYKTMENKIDGVLIAWVDIDAVKLGVAQIQVGRDYATALIETVPTPLLILGSSLHLRAANRAFYDTFQIKPDEVPGQSIHELGEGRWNTAQVRAALAADRLAGDRYATFELAAQLDGRPRTFAVTAHRAYVDDPLAPVIVAVMNEVKEP